MRGFRHRTGSVASVDAEVVEIDDFGWQGLVRCRAGQGHVRPMGGRACRRVASSEPLI